MYVCMYVLCMYVICIYVSVQGFYICKVDVSVYVFYRIKHNICISTYWRNIIYIRATCFGRKTAIIRQLLCVATDKSSLGRLTLELSRPHTQKKQSVGLFWTSDRLAAEAATYTTYNKHKRRHIYAFSRIWNKNVSIRAAADLRLTPHGSMDPFWFYCFFVL